MAQYELNLHDYWRIIKRRYLTVTLTFVFVLLSTFIYTSLQDPVFETSATIQIERGTKLGRDLGIEFASYDSWTETVTYVRIINSPIVYEELAKNLGLLEGLTDRVQIDSIIGRVGSKIEAKRVRDTNLIQIVGISTNPEEAAVLSNEAVKAFMSKNLEARSKNSREIKEFIGEQLRQAEEKLKITEETRREFVENNEVTGLGDQLTSRFLRLQEQKDDLLKKYTVAHPEVRKISSQIAKIEKRLKELPASELELARFVRDVKINEEAFMLLKRKYKDAELAEANESQNIVLISPAAIPTYPVRPNKELNMMIGILMGILLGLIFALITENLDTSIGTIEDVEAFLQIPVLGVIPHIEFDKKERSLLSKGGASKVQKYDKMYNSLIFFHSLRSPFVEAYHTLRTNVKLGTAEKRGTSVLFTSSGVNEGKSVTSMNYSISASMVGIKTLLIELDLRRPTVSKIFGLPKEMGLTNILQGNVKWQDVIKGTSDFMMGKMGVESVLKSPGLENLKILTCGSIPPNPVDLLNSEEIGRLLAQFKKEFDLVVLDCPPVLLFADSMIIANKVDSVIIVYQVGKMARGALKRTKIQLENTKAHILGVVLNDIRASEMESRYGYYYSTYKYYNEAGQKKEENKT
ncbi:MAG: polysaccharide biosynthesis tyrosine autokinase [bacterium]